MARPQGRVVERDGQRGTTFAIRFVAGSERRYQTLGTTEQGWTRARAHAELQNVLADVRRGIWTPPKPRQEPVRDVDQDPTFHVFASEWFEAHKGEWREGTRLDYQWHLSHHLLPFFKSHRLSQITLQEVDRFKTVKVAEAAKVRAAAAAGKAIMYEYTDKRGCKYRRPRRPLSVTSINKMLTRLSQILELAVEYGHIPTNPAKGQRRRLKGAKPAPVWLDSAAGIEALLDAAGELDRELKTRTPRRTILSTLVFSGLRISELVELRWRDVDLAAGRITVRASKTDAGMRRIDLLPALHHELKTYKAGQTYHDGRVFSTSTGGPLNPSNIRNRVLAPAVKRANKNLAKAELVPLPEGLSPHKLRHTYTSVLAALGTDPGAMMDQLGHTDPGFTLGVYRHSMRRDQESKDRLRALVGEDVEAPQAGVSGTNSGTNGQNGGVSSTVERNGH
jgi:integrase